MSEVRIAAEPRTEFGKGAARAVRRANKVPVVLYGHGEEPRHFSLPGHDLMLALRHDPNALLTLDTADGDQLALPKQIVRDPIKGFLEHVDLLAVRKGEKVIVDVAVHTTGETTADVLVDVQQNTVSVEAEATHIPESFSVDVTGLKAGGTITASDLELPKGVSLNVEGDLVVVQGLGAPTAADVEAELDQAAAELAPEPAAGDETAEGDAAPADDESAESSDAS